MLRNCFVSEVVCDGVWEGGGCTGMNLQRNFLLQMVSLPEPSTPMTYRSNWQISATRPVLSHLVG